jgi:hypothetical protein
MSTMTTTTGATGASMSPRRLMLMRAVYGFVGVGLVVSRWPLLSDASELPRYEGTTLALLAGMSVLMLLGLRYPVQLLPMLLFESLWKLIWLGAVALPLVVSGDLDDDIAETLVNCLLVVPVLIAVPWGYVWRTYVREPGEAWR